jgi:hypothetical protein
MSYHCGLDDRLNGVPGKPHIKCDLCGIEHTVYDPQWKGPIPSIWFLDGLPAPGWQGGRNSDGSRTDYCDECIKAREEPIPTIPAEPVLEVEVEQVPAVALPPQDDTVEEIEAVTRREDLVNSDPRQAELSASRDYQLELAVLANLQREARGGPYVSYGPEHEIQSLTRLVEVLDELDELESLED